MCPGNKLTITGTRRGDTLALPRALRTVLRAYYFRTRGPCNADAARHCRATDSARSSD